MGARPRRRRRALAGIARVGFRCSMTAPPRGGNRRRSTSSRRHGAGLPCLSLRARRRAFLRSRSRTRPQVLEKSRCGRTSSQTEPAGRCPLKTKRPRRGLSIFCARNVKSETMGNPSERAGQAASLNHHRLPAPARTPALGDGRHASGTLPRPSNVARGAGASETHAMSTHRSGPSPALGTERFAAEEAPSFDKRLTPVVPASWPETEETGADATPRSPEVALPTSNRVSIQRASEAASAIPAQGSGRPHPLLRRARLRSACRPSKPTRRTRRPP